jgi:hypothetical protein
MPVQSFNGEPQASRVESAHLANPNPMNKAFVREPDSSEVRCPRCGALGESALRAAFEAHVPEPERRGMAASASFCPTPSCPVAYFDAFEAVVPTEALVRPVYPKDPAAPLCACFGLTLDDVDADLAEGTPRRIRALLAQSKTDDARCEERSPTGRCSIAEVQRQYFKRMKGEG